MCLFGYSHPSGCEVVSDCDFDLHFPGSSDTFIVNLPTISIVFSPSGNSSFVLFCLEDMCPAMAPGSKGRKLNWLREYLCA